jgi:hypothetical protein
VSATPIASDLAIALDREATARQAADLNVAELLERIALVTGVDLSTAPTPEAVAAGLAVLDSLASPTTSDSGWCWNNAAGTSGSFSTREQAQADAGDRRHGYFVMCVRDGLAGPPLYCPPTRGSN